MSRPCTGVKVGSRDVSDTMVLGCRGYLLHAVLRLHARRISLSDGSCARTERKRVGRDQVFTLWRLPRRTLPWRDVQNVHCINLFQRAALVFAEEEVDDDCTCNITSCKDVTVPITDVMGDERGELKSTASAHVLRQTVDLIHLQRQ